MRSPARIFRHPATLVVIGLLLGELPWNACARGQQTGDERCSLAIKLVDAQTGAAVPGIIRIRDAAGENVALAELVNRGQGVEDAGPIHDWWVLSEPRTIAVPRAPLLVQALSGLGTELAEQPIDLTGRSQAKLEIVLTHFADAFRRDHRAGNTHLHLRKLSKAQAERDLREVPCADGLDVVFVSYLERAGDDLEYTSNHFTPDDLQKLSDDRVRFGYGQEHRHNFGSYGEGYGHVLLLDIPHVVQPVSIGAGITKRGPDAPPLQTGIDEARRLGGKAVWAHNRQGFENIPNWVLGHLHANNMRDGNDHGDYADPYYRYLNIGQRVPLSAGTDWFMYDFSRAYVLASQDTTPSEWLERLAAGKSTITNGPLLELTVDGRELGSVIELAAPRKVAIRCRALGRADFRSIELVRNGKLVRAASSRLEGGHFVADIELSLLIDAPSWLALRTPYQQASGGDGQRSFTQNEFAARLFAHTSPIYVQLAGRDVFDPATARGLIEEMRAELAKILAQAIFDDDSQRQSVVAVYEQAIAALTTRPGATRRAVSDCSGGRPLPCENCTPRAARYSQRSSFGSQQCGFQATKSGLRPASCTV